MASRYDENTKARAVRLVREHGGDYETEWAAMKAISARLGMSAETLRKWVRQAEVDAGEVAGVPTETARELRELRRKCRELESTKSSRPQQVSSRGSATRYTADLRIHRRTPAAVRGRTDLPGLGGARRADRPAHLLGASIRGAVETGAVGHHDRRDPGRHLRTRRRWETPAGIAVRQPEDVGLPAARGHPGGQVHGGADHARQRLARCDPGSPQAAHYRIGSGREPSA
jgi:transposase